MLRNYFKVAWRNLRKSKLYSSINIIGLATGMAVAMLIGLWVFDELSFDKQHMTHYDQLGQVWQNVNFGGSSTGTYHVVPIPMAEALKKYPEVEKVSLVSDNAPKVLAVGDTRISRSGIYAEPDFPEMFSLKMLAGSRKALSDMNSILLSRSVAKALFGDRDPLNQMVRIENKSMVRVGGVYEDFPHNSSFNELYFIGAWDKYMAGDTVAQQARNGWFINSWYVYAQLKPGADFGLVSAKIKDILNKSKNPPPYKASYFLFPMSSWHLHADFKDGVNIGGLVGFLWLFGIIGVFVLLLACINFMNLSTARSEKRAKEVGIRKAIGSVRRQLVIQFLSESLLVVFFSFLLSLVLVELSLPFFNGLADKKMTVLWGSPLFWAAGIGFSLFTGLVAGSYPALYLSSFKAVRVLKGTFKAGRFAAVPRRVLVTVQFTVSVTLIIATIVVFRQIEFAREIPVGYARNGLIEINMNTPELMQHYNELHSDLLNSGGAIAFSESSCSITGQNNGTVDVRWAGKDPNIHPLVMANYITSEFGKAVSWKVLQGRDFDAGILTDSSAMLLNETAVRLMGFKQPLGQIITRGGRPYRVVGVVADMIRESPFSPVKPSIFQLSTQYASTIQVRLAPQLSTGEALAKVESVFRKINPQSPFDYRWVDEDYGHKFSNEQRLGSLASFFAVLAIFISCLGLFGLASFIAEQRTKEISVRKVLGASLFNVWKLLSREFVLLVLVSLLVSMPVAYYFMHQWLQNYVNHIGLSWWIFAAAGIGAMGITLLTVSFQAIKAGMANPVKSLRNE